MDGAYKYTVWKLIKINLNKCDDSLSSVWLKEKYLLQ